MNNTWKLSIMGAVALAASSAVMAIGCTVTTTSGPLDDGGTADSSTSDGGTDSATADSGGDTGTTTCTATTACPIIASNNGVTFDNPSCGTCDKCSATNCCAQVTKCFTPEDGGTSDCESLFNCLLTCAAQDAGVDMCKAACKAAYPQQAFDDLTAADTCQTNSCAMDCQ